MMKTMRAAGFLAAFTYLAPMLVAYVLYPRGSDPLHNWLSDLGDALVNPRGAVFYNAGCAVTALLLTAFYLGLSAWRNGDRVLGTLLTVAQAAGSFPRWP